MAKRSWKSSKARLHAEDIKKRKQLAEWTAKGRSKELATQYGIMADMFPEDVSENEKKSAQVELKEVSDKVVALQDKTVTLWKKDESNAKELGIVLLQIKTIIGHGKFGKWCQKAGLEQNRVSYCMRLAAPEGNKVQAAKERVKKSPRAKALRDVLKKVSALYDLAEQGETEKAKELFKEIKTYIEAKIITALDKPKAKAAAA